MTLGAMKLDAGTGDDFERYLDPDSGDYRFSQVAGPTEHFTATFNRPADTTAYTAKDLVANSTTAGSVAALTWSNVCKSAALGGYVTGLRLSKNNDNETNAVFRVHLFTENPVATAPAGGDNALIDVDVAAIEGYIGYFDVDFSAADNPDIFGAALNATFGSPMLSKGALPFHGDGQTSLYGLIEAKGAYTPASGETFVCDIWVSQD